MVPVARHLLLRFLPDEVRKYFPSAACLLQRVRFTDEKKSPFRARARRTAINFAAKTWSRTRLPDVHPLVCRPHHRGAIGNIERLLEFHEIREMHDRPESPRRMRVGIQSQLEIFVELIVSPDLGVGEEESLLGGKPIDLWLRSFLRERLLLRHV